MKTHAAVIGSFARWGLVGAATCLLTAIQSAAAKELEFRHLPKRIEALEAVVEASPAESPPPMVSLNAAPGAILSQTVHQDCIIGEQIDCTEKLTVLISVPPGSRARVDFDVAWLEGQPDVDLDLENVEHPGPGGRKIVGEITFESQQASFELRPEDPNLYAQELGYTGPLSIRMALVSDSLVAFTMDPAQVRQKTFESQGVILEAFVRPYAAGAREAQIEVEIANYGSETAGYLVTVRDCSDNIEPGVPFQLAWLEPSLTDSRTLVFDVKSNTAFAPGNTCEVWLEAPTARGYDSVQVTFDPP